MSKEKFLEGCSLIYDSLTKGETNGDETKKDDESSDANSKKEKGGKKSKGRPKKEKDPKEQDGSDDDKKSEKVSVHELKEALMEYAKKCPRVMKDGKSVSPAHLLLWEFGKKADDLPYADRVACFNKAQDKITELSKK